MNIAIVGFDREGRASYEFLKDKGHTITICDQNDQVSIPAGVSSQLGESYLDELDAFDMILRTPSLHPAKILAANPNVGDKISSQTNLFFEHCPTKNIIGVTGTKGKGTTSTLISKMLEADGKHVVLAGNIGIPMLSRIHEITPDSWVVLELSNFQLIDLHHSPHIATVLMVVAEHLDWHEDMEEYIAAKQQLFINQSEEDVAIYYANNDNAVSIADASMGQQIPFFEAPGAFVENQTIQIDGQTICTLDEIALRGEHNWQNVCAAVTTVWQVTQNVAALKQAITSFTGLPFRIELRREVNGIRYYNDSFATGPGAAIAAMQAITEPKVLIIGGYDRMLDLGELAAAIRNNQSTIRKVVLIGASADRTTEALKAVDYTNFTHCRAQDMPAIVASATAEAQPGDAVVLSPSFASFDMFKNFEHRGECFNDAVAKL